MFGVKTTFPQTDPRFKSHPFVPVSCCDVTDKTGKYMLAGYGKLYKKAAHNMPYDWAPVGEL